MSLDFRVDRDSPKWVLGPNGYLIQYGNDEPAIEFNADGSYKGVLVEPESTNTVRYSENFSPGYWIDSFRVSVETNNILSPNNTISADKITTTSNGNCRIGRGSGDLFPIVSKLNNYYSQSVFVKRGNYDYIYLGNFERTRPGYGVLVFNLLTGQITDTANSRHSILKTEVREYPNGWYRISIVVRNSDRGLGEWVMGFSETENANITGNYDNQGDNSYSGGAGNYFYAWGAQLEANTSTTSYIFTNGSYTTRLKDDIYITGASSLIGQTEGTLFVEVDWQLTSGTTQILLGATDATFSNGFRIYNDSSPVKLIMRARADSNDLTLQGEASTAYTGIQKIAFAYAENDFELYRNGSSISSDTSGSLSALATVTDIDFGQSSGATVQANMWIRAVALFTTRLSDAEAYSLTGYDTYAQMANALQYTIL